MERKIYQSLVLLVAISVVTCLAISSDKSDHASGKTPILLVHGLGCNSTDWDQLPEILRDYGYPVYVLDYNDWDWLPNAYHLDILLEDLCVPLARQLEQIVIETGHGKIDVIAHGFGGIIVRSYIADWGDVVERAAAYNNDIKSVIYLGTPFFGLNADEETVRDMVEETDYGPFKNKSLMRKSMMMGSAALMELHHWFLVNGGTRSQIDELFVSSRKDRLVPRYSANAIGVHPDPEEATNLQHLQFKDLVHTVKPFSSSGDSLIAVDSEKHPVAQLALKYFSGDKSWEDLGNNKSSNRTILAIQLEKATGLNPRNVDPEQVSLKRYKPNNKRKKNARLKINEQSMVFYYNHAKDANYELTVPVHGKEKVFNFAFNVIDNSINILEFDADSPPDDPFDSGGGDGGGGGGSDPTLPGAVYDKTTLRQFVNAAFASQANTYQSPANLKALAMSVRDKLAETYTNIERVNDQQTRHGYSAAGDKHADAIYLVNSSKVIDFVNSLSSGGVLNNKLQWVAVSAPW